MKIKSSFAVIAMMLTIMTAKAQMLNPVHFSSQLKELGGAEAEIIFSATIDTGWHVYSTNLGNDGPISASFNAVKMEGVETVGKLQPRGKEIKQYDPMFGMELRFFEGSVTFVQKVRFTKPNYQIDCYLEYGACNDESCMPPSEVPLKLSGKSPIKAEQQEEPQTTKEQDVATTIPSATEDSLSTENQHVAIDTLQQSSNEQSLWEPVISELREGDGNNSLTDHSLLYILLMGFVGGLLAVCMPCIWPIIPMTVSFFLKRAKSDKRKGIRDAFTYGISIIVIYLALGLLVTAFLISSFSCYSWSLLFHSLVGLKSSCPTPGPMPSILKHRQQVAL